MVIMVITGIIGMTAGAVVIVVETEGLVVVVALVIAEAVAAVETEGRADADNFFVVAVADRGTPMRQVADKVAKAIEKTNIYEITENNSRCYNPKEPSIGKHRKVASVRRRREETPLLLVRML